MIECNIYSGHHGKITYQFTANYETLIDAELDAQEVSELDANEYGYPLEECDWLAVETDKDNIPYDQRVGYIDYM